MASCSTKRVRICWRQSLAPHCASRSSRSGRQLLAWDWKYEYARTPIGKCWHEVRYTRTLEWNVLMTMIHNRAYLTLCSVHHQDEGCQPLMCSPKKARLCHKKVWINKFFFVLGLGNSVGCDDSRMESGRAIAGPWKKVGGQHKCLSCMVTFCWNED